MIRAERQRYDRDRISREKTSRNTRDPRKAIASRKRALFSRNEGPSLPPLSTPNRKINRYFELRSARTTLFQLGLKANKT
jgi:hypothetical protein